jgi:hypothetical protein
LIKSELIPLFLRDPQCRADAAWPASGDMQQGRMILTQRRPCPLDTVVDAL